MTKLDRKAKLNFVPRGSRVIVGDAKAYFDIIRKGVLFKYKNLSVSEDMFPKTLRHFKPPYVPKVSDFSPQIKNGTIYKSLLFTFHGVPVYEHPNFLPFWVSELTHCPFCGTKYSKRQKIKKCNNVQCLKTVK